MTCIRLTAILTLYALACGTPCAAEGDTAEFKVSSYIPDKFTDFEWRLDGGMNLKRSGSDKSTDYYPGSGSTDTKQQNTSVSNGLLDFRSRWQYLYETRQALWDLDWYLDLDYLGYSNSDTEDKVDFQGYPFSQHTDYESQTYRLGIGFDGEGTQYMWSDLFFSGRLNWDYSYEYRESSRHTEMDDIDYLSHLNADLYMFQTDRTKGESNRRKFDLDGELLFGLGRVYQGEFAAAAMAMTDELRQRGLLRATPSTQHMIGFSKLIHSSRVRFYPDFRENRTAALQSLIDFLDKRGYVIPNTEAALLVIEDVWDYYPVWDRQFGSTVRFGFGGNDDYANDDESYETETARRSYLIYLDSAVQTETQESVDRSVDRDGSRYFVPQDYFLLRMERFCPISLRWQWDTEIDTRWYLNKEFGTRTPEQGVVNVGHNWRLAGFETELLYLHDARTSMRLGIELVGEWKEWVRIWPIRGEGGRWVYRTLGANIRFAVAYRISVPTAVSLDWHHYRYRNDVWRSDQHDRHHVHGFELSAGVTHWLF